MIAGKIIKKWTLTNLFSQKWCAPILLCGSFFQAVTSMQQRPKAIGWQLQVHVPSINCTNCRVGNCDVALASTRKCINHLDYLLEILIDSNTLLSFKNGSHTGRDDIEVHYSSYQTFICSALNPEETRG